VDGVSLDLAQARWRGQADDSHRPVRRRSRRRCSLGRQSAVDERRVQRGPGKELDARGLGVRAQVCLQLPADRDGEVRYPDGRDLAGPQPCRTGDRRRVPGRHPVAAGRPRLARPGPRVRGVGEGNPHLPAPDNPVRAAVQHRRDVPALPVAGGRHRVRGGLGPGRRPVRHHLRCRRPIGVDRQRSRGRPDSPVATPARIGPEGHSRGNGARIAPGHPQAVGNHAPGFARGGRSPAPPARRRRRRGSPPLLPSFRCGQLRTATSRRRPRRLFRPPSPGPRPWRRPAPRRWRLRRRSRSRSGSGGLRTVGTAPSSFRSR